jgi:hypothetical protein
MEPEDIVPFIQRYPEVIAWLVGHVVLLVFLARLSDWLTPKIEAWAKSTPAKWDDKLAFALIHLGIGLHWMIRLVRVLLPAARMEPSPFAYRPPPRRPPFPPTAVILLVLVCLASIGACGPGVGETARSFDDEVGRCQANEARIARDCGTQSECAPALLAERTRCAEALDRICNRNRRARGVCAGRGEL